MELLAVYSDNNKAVVLGRTRDVNNLSGRNRYRGLVIVPQGKHHSRAIEAMEHTPSFRSLSTEQARLDAF
jgi:hypothetical protein